MNDLRKRRMLKRIAEAVQKRTKRKLDFAKSWLRRRGVFTDEESPCYFRVPGSRIVSKVIGKVGDVFISEIKSCSNCHNSREYFRIMGDRGIEAEMKGVCCRDLDRIRLFLQEIKKLNSIINSQSSTGKIHVVTRAEIYNGSPESPTTIKAKLDKNENPVCFEWFSPREAREDHH